MKPSSKEVLGSSKSSIWAMSKNLALLSIESWLFNRDPYVMVYYDTHITG